THRAASATDTLSLHDALPISPVPRRRSGMTIGMPRIDRLPAQERGLTVGDFLVPIRISERLHTRARHLALILIGTALIVLCARRSEEHTSELQSRVDLVCRLL